ncbi:DUF2071 domain-containing protein [Peribacillus psychrosaccharolyticus]|uniref:DUF2071 domain-containing protein n=1 Tax=Peribacillus psychrosaccharolyticus TaxID=1407 RepID=A0A974S0W5_PERPY|nr:DUF2071 domain-containing protein [Peribacillus psychrosaccharolyticus]
MKEKSKPKQSLWDDSHRLWPLPRLPWTMKQTWNDLLFAHYPIKMEVLKKLVPEVLPLDSYNGMCWIGIVPFHMTGIRLRGMSPVPGTDRFPELNVRTYVTVAGKPGVYFFSLDAANRLAVEVAKKIYHLPYVYADMKVNRNGEGIHYESRRRSSLDAQFIGEYRPISEPYYAIKGSFDEWITERYCLYTLNNKGFPLRCDILHKPWVLQDAEAEISHNTMLSSQGIQVESEKPILHFSKTIDVRMWPLVRAE